MLPVVTVQWLSATFLNSVVTAVAGRLTFCPPTDSDCAGQDIEATPSIGVSVVSTVGQLLSSAPVLELASMGALRLFKTSSLVAQTVRFWGGTGLPSGPLPVVFMVQLPDLAAA